jgi:putative addiction module component (TIGR02574 family)
LILAPGRDKLRLMSPRTERLLTDALHLPREVRAFLAEKLLESLDSEEGFEVTAEWQQEIRRRCQELDEGKTRLIPGDEVIEGLAGEFE